MMRALVRCLSLLGLLGVLGVLGFLGFASARAQGADVPGSGTAGGAAAAPARKAGPVLRLPRGTGVATVKSVDGSVLLIQGNRFSRVAVGDALVVLNRPRNGILARLVVKALLLDGHLEATLERAGGGVVAQKLIDQPVLLERDALLVREQLGKGPLAPDDLAVAPASSGADAPADAGATRRPSAVNPTVGVSMVGSWEERTGVVYLLSTPVDASQRSTRVRGEAFAPWIALAPWLNWFGVEVEAQLPAEGNLSLGDASRGGWAVRYETSALSVGISARAVFDSPWVSRAGLALNVIDRVEEKLAFTGGPRGEATSSVFERSGTSLEAMAESNPGRIAIVALKFRKPLGSKVTVVERGALGPVEHKGTLAGQTMTLEGGVRLPLLDVGGLFTWETRAGLEARSETIETSAYEGKREFSTQAFRIQTGFAWAP